MINCVLELGFVDNENETRNYNLHVRKIIPGKARILDKDKI
jgi:hypothetical protein